MPHTEIATISAKSRSDEPGINEIATISAKSRNDTQEYRDCHELQK